MSVQKINKFDLEERLKSTETAQKNMNINSDLKLQKS